MGANVPYYNPAYPPNDLPGQSLVPAVLANGRTWEVVWVEYETNKAEVVCVDLLYTYEGFSANQAWLRTVATITEPGRAEISAPTGTTHYVFNLVDENNFMVSYPSVGTANDGIPDSALALSFAEPIHANPAPQDTYYAEDFSSTALGGNLLRDSVGFHAAGSGAWEIDGGRLSNTSTENNYVSEGAAGTIIDLSSLEDPTVSEFTLSFDYTLAEYTETLMVHVWGYIDLSSSPGTAIMNLGAQWGMWYTAGGAFLPYNLRDGSSIDYNTHNDTAAVQIPSGSGTGLSYSDTVHLGSFGDGLNRASDYDYIVIGIQKGTAAATLILDGLTLRARQGEGTLLALH